MVLWLLSLYHFWSLFSFLFVTYQLYHNTDSQNDAEKLNEFITNPEKMKGLEKLYHKVTNGKEKFDISIGIGAKTSPAARALDVDYIFMFDIDDTAIDKTVVRYNIAIIDTALINKFSPLINENGKLAGELSYPEIYVIQ